LIKKSNFIWENSKIFCEVVYDTGITIEFKNKIMAYLPDIM